MELSIVVFSSNFNSRPSARGDVLATGKMTIKENISIHAPPRGATTSQSTMFPASSPFQFTPLREGRRSCFSPDCRYRNFNSRPSARGDKNKAPDRKGKTIFQFTPLREGRHFCLLQLFPFWNFNSRPSARGDRAGNGNRLLPPEISIHAPPRGATKWRDVARSTCEFQFTPLREGRQERRKPSSRRKPFQFTPLREGRLYNTSIYK